MSDDAATRAERVRAILAAARQLTVVATREAGPLLARFDLTIAGRAILERIAANRAATVPDLAAHFLMSRQAVQRVVDSLKKRNLLRVSTNPKHARSVLLELTEQGKEVLTAVIDQETEYLSSIIAYTNQVDIDSSTKILRLLTKELCALGTSPAAMRRKTAK